jgi:hypothetical protein
VIFTLRNLLIAMAAAGGAVSVALAALYGAKSADTGMDGLASGTMFGLLALFAFVLHGVAVGLWVKRHPAWSVVIGCVAAAALVVTITNSLGAIAGRGDTTLALRTKMVEERRDARTELARLEKALGDLGQFTPTDAEAVAAAKRAADTASTNRNAECDKRGNNCRQREIDEQAAATRLAAASAAKASTDRAAKLEASIATVRVKLSKGGELVANPNPLLATLTAIFGEAAAALTAWQQVVVATVFEFCLAAIMVSIVLFGEPGAGVPTTAAASTSTRQNQAAAMPLHIAPPRPAAAARSTRPKPNGAPPPIETFFADKVADASRAKLDMKELLTAYRSWRSAEGLPILGPDALIDEIEGACRKRGARIAPEGQRVLCTGLALRVTSTAATASPAV